MKQGKYIFYAILAAALYAVNSPFSKLLLEKLSPTMLAALLYLGAGIGMLIVGVIQRKIGFADKEKPLKKRSCRTPSEWSCSILPHRFFL